MNRTRRVAVVARSVFPLHGPGGLERSVFDLVRHLIRADVAVTLITRTPPEPVEPAAIDSRLTMQFVPYRTFPFAGRRGTTVLDRSTAYPLFGERAGRAAWELVQQGAIDLVHGFGASVLGYARRRAQSQAPLVLNPQGLEEFGATDPDTREVEAGRVPAASPCRPTVRTGGRPHHRDRSCSRTSGAYSLEGSRFARTDHSQCAGSRDPRWSCVPLGWATRPPGSSYQG